MKKTLFALAIAAAAAVSASAESYDFSYVDGADNYLGIQAAETYDVGIFLPGDLFEGFTLTAIRANLNSQGGVTAYADPKVWVSSTLDLDDTGAFVPDIATSDAEIGSNGVLLAGLPDSYTITADGVYMGYTVTVARLNAGTKFPMGFSDCSDPNSFFCRTSKSMPQWSNLATDMDCGAAVTAVLESDAVAAHNVMLTSVPNAICMMPGEGWSGAFGLTSYSKDPVKSVDLEYSILGKTYTDHFDLTKEVTAGLGKRFEVNVIIEGMEQEMAENVVFKVTKVNGEANESNRPWATVPLVVATEYPAHQTLFEEYTGTWCGNCVRGYAALEWIKENEPDFVVAAFHNGDPMTITDNYPVPPSVVPFATLNRKYGGDPYFWTGAFDGTLYIVDEIKALNAEITPWGIEVAHEWDGEDTLVAKADVWNLAGYAEGDYAIAYLLVADGLTGKSTSWFQTNYYNTDSQSDAYIPQLNMFCKGGEYGKSKVGGLEFNDVVVSTDGIYGIEGSIPSALQPGEKTSHSLSFDLSEISSTLIPDRNKLRVIAAILDKNGFVLNCAKNEVNDYIDTAVEGIDAADAPAEYYDLRGMKVAAPTQGIYIRRQGAKTEKIVVH